MRGDFDEDEFDDLGYDAAIDDCPECGANPDEPHGLGCSHADPLEGDDDEDLDNDPNLDYDGD